MPVPFGSRGAIQLDSVGWVPMLSGSSGGRVPMGCVLGARTLGSGGLVPLLLG